jgi:hypothetical protein
MMRDQREAAGIGCTAGVFLFVVSIALVVIGLAISYVHYGTLPYFLNAETNANRASYQYVETKADLLLKLQADYESPDATDAQKLAIVRRMRAERALLHTEQVPPSVNSFLASH